MKSNVALLVFFACVVLSAGSVVGQLSVSSSVGTDVAYAASAAYPSSGEVAEPWIVAAGITPEVTKVREALDKFTVNFESRDVDRLKNESWPSMSPKAYGQLKNTFAVLSQISLHEDCSGSPIIVIDSADWACREKLRYQVDGEPRPPQTHSLQFHLKKVEGKWYVEGRTVGGK